MEKEQEVDSEAVLGWPEASALETCTEGSVRGGWGEAQNGGRKEAAPSRPYHCVDGWFYSNES